MNGEKLIENKELRDKNIDRIDVLEHVKEILTLGNTDFSTVELVSNYYEVKESTIQECIRLNKEELNNDGLKKYKKNEIISMFKRNPDDLENVKNEKTKSVITFKNNKNISINNTGLILIPKRAILRIGMLLRDSDIAKEIRTRILDIVHDAEEETEIINDIIEEIRTEQEISEDMLKAIIAGDRDKLSLLQTEYIGLKNKRIYHLENIVANSVTITESKAVINKCIRLIATEKFDKMFYKAWDEFYRFLNYKLGINVKNRKGKGLARFSNNEILEMEKIAKSWLERNDIDLKLVI
ncbi:TPA: hypothetical protein KQE61_003660 [Clostridioides difficile]|uniref:hypothetical protein n=1 Tax=Clostridioides difficile TaxID=1496 RepID=UPI0003B2A5A4|nr:hypothetical protein [Clostridioides difficile]MBG0269183.1 hypothetical protein [Clostridioides difficile]MBY1726007.1 hypothetical protein [Clostridioides difficile]MBZ1202722.1 hypothetical protein [Clostridioides difficile]MDB0341059.1 hypothetical protein [Clostridioides difficile]MDC9313240.1 hypothetical protein [Clostridioides difficile]